MTSTDHTPPGGPPAQPVANLPVFETLGAAFAVTFRDPALLLRAALGGLLLLTAANLVSYLLPFGHLAMVLAVAAPLVAYTHFGVNWYRVVLLGPEGLVHPVLRWERRHWLFLGAGIALSAALLALGMLLLRALPAQVSQFVMIFLLYLGTRFSFLFPTIAVGESYSPGYAWRHTQGQGLRLTALHLLAGMPLTIAIIMISGLLFTTVLGISLVDLVAQQSGEATAFEVQPGEGGGAQISPVAMLLVKLMIEAMTMAALGVQIAIVAIAFRVCTGWVPPAPPALAEVFGAAEDEDGGGPRDG